MFETRSTEGKSSKSIPLPREVIDKQVAVARQPRRVFKSAPSPLSAEAAVNQPGTGPVVNVEETSKNIDAEAETRKPKAALFTSMDEMEEFRKRLRDIDSGKIPKDNKRIADANERWELAMARIEDSIKTAKSSQEKAVTFAAPVVTGFLYYPPEYDSEEDDFEEDALSRFRYHPPEEDSEEDQVEEDECEEDDSDTELTIEDPDDVEVDDEFEEGFEGDPPTLHFPDLPISNPVSEGKPERQKRKRESDDPSDSPTFEDVDHNEQRKKQKTGSSSENSTGTPELNSLELEILREFENPDDSSIDVPELTDIDLMLLGEQPSDPGQTQSSVNEDLGMFIGETL